MPAQLHLSDIGDLPLLSVNLPTQNRNAREISVTRTRDDHSTALFRASLNGQVFEETVLTFSRSDPDSERSDVYMRITLVEAMISSYQVSGDGTESFTLNFTQMIVQQQGSGGDDGP